MRIATTDARRPTTRPSASIKTHFLSTSAGFSEVVFIALVPLSGCRAAQVLKRQAAAKNAAASWRLCSEPGIDCQRATRTSERGKSLKKQSKFSVVPWYRYNRAVLV